MVASRFQTPLVIGLAALLLVVLALALGAGNPDTYSHAVNQFRVYALARPFSDLRESLRWLECTRSGYDLYAPNPCHIAFNYPPGWLALAPLGLGQPDAGWLGLLMAAGLLASYMILFAGVPLRKSWIALLFLCGPPTLFLLERANLDIICFVLLLCAGLLLDKPRRFGGLAAGLLCAAATALKLYPVAAAALVLVPARQFRIAGIIVLVLGLVLILQVLPHSRSITQNTTYGIVMVHGYLTGFWRLQAFLQGDTHYLVRATADPINSAFTLAARLALLVAMGLAAGLALRWRNQRWLPALPQDRYGAWYLLGTGVFVCTFLLPTNWIYRLAFLTLCAPCLLQWLGQQEWRIRSFPGLVLGVILALIWTERLYRYSWGLEHVLAWLLFVLFGAQFLVLLLAQVPGRNTPAQERL